MLRTATPADLPALRDLLARATDAPYDAALVAEEKCFAPGFAGEPVVRVVEEDARIVGVAVTCGHTLRILAVDREYRRRGIGSRLLEDAAPDVIAAEAGNYFTPGVVDEDVDTLRFFHARGYVEARSAYNLHVDVDGIEAPDRPRRAMDGDRERVLEFVEREFGRIWRFEASRGTIFFIEENGEVAGFSTHEANNRGLGWFGPTGVAKSMRMRGYGRQLIHASLADLRRLGYSRAIIAWTEATQYYRRVCGAEPAHRFVTLSRRP